MPDTSGGWTNSDPELAARFPRDFVFGVATSAYQIEGAAGGRGPSIWDRFAEAGGITGGENAEVACDHVNRWPEDLDLMASLGIRSYRLSVSWPRLQPTGRGPLARAGVEFYRQLLSGLLERRIRPFVTLYHWELPQSLEDEGGWPTRDTAYRFADFAEQVVLELGDLVGDWITLNEPWCSAFLGYGTGAHAPGRTDLGDAIAAAHHLNLAHGLATQRIRSHAPQARVGITNLVTDLVPASESDADHAAASRLDAQHNRIFLGPVYCGAYDDQVLEIFGPHGLSSETVRPLVQDSDLDTISAPTDFVGLNHYHRAVVSDDPSEPAPLHVRQQPPEAPKTDMGWAVTPEALRQVLLRIRDDYAALPIMVTENGAAYADAPGSDDTVDDPHRVAYLRSYLDAVARAIEEGVTVAGYFAWSFMDNFEWAYGYDKRFGLVYVDYATQRRLPKTSAAWYRQLLSAH